MPKIRTMLRVVGRDISKVVTPLTYPVLGNLPASWRQGLEKILPDFNLEHAAKTSCVTNIPAYIVGASSILQHLVNRGYNIFKPNEPGPIAAGIVIGSTVGGIEWAIRTTDKKNGSTYGSLIGTLASLPITIPASYIRSIYSRAKERERENQAPSHNKPY